LKIKIEVLYDPAITVLVTYPKEIKKSISKRHLFFLDYYSTAHNRQGVETNCKSTDE
jgi:hypothetical protein